MRFKDTLRDIPVGGVTGRLLNSGRFFTCDVCRKAITPWRETSGKHEVPVCSDECLDELDDRRASEPQGENSDEPRSEEAVPASN